MADITQREGDEITVSVTVKLTGSMLEMEETIQDAVNEVGLALTEEALQRFEATGMPITIADIKMTSKDKVKKVYETPYGSVALERFVYQTAKGGGTYCPLDENARIIVCSTPKFAKMISHKYGSASSQDVREDLSMNHRRYVTRGFIQNISDAIGTIVSATEAPFSYDLPELTEPVATIAFSLDGTYMLMRKQGYHEAMTGNISLYDAKGERLHTIYIGAAPEYGKEKFIKRLQAECDKMKKCYPHANYVGIADGAAFNWGFLEPNTTYHVLDFWHATEYLGDASAAFGKSEAEQKAWLETACHALKHDAGAADLLLKEMQKKQEVLTTKKGKETIKEKLAKAVTYFSNQKHRMNYKELLDQHFPIGSGVTEAACKTLIKERLCRSGMQWKNDGATVVIDLRALKKTKGRWEQFWNKIMAMGLSSITLH